MNPATGDLYYRKTQVGLPTIGSSQKLLGSATAFTDLPSFATGYEQIAIGTCFWSGQFVGAGSQGAFMIFNSGDSFGTADDGQIAALDPLTDLWFFDSKGMAPFYESNGSTYHSVMEYSPIMNVAVYGGGNDAPRKLWRLNADASVTVMPAVPVGKAVGIQGGNLVADPVSGHFLVLSAGELWDLDPSGAGTWAQQTGPRTPPAEMGIPGPTNPDGVVSASIPEYGVVVYITQTSSTGGRVFVYKP